MDNRAYDLVRAPFEAVIRGMETKSNNTSFHPESDLPADHGIDTAIPSEEPYSFGRWARLIMKLCRSSTVPQVSLTRSQAQLLVDAAAVSIVTRELSRAHKEVLDELLEPAFENLDFGRTGLFVRLNSCSPKDGEEAPKKPLRGVSGVILRLTTSERARNAIVKELESGVSTVNLFFMPFDRRFDPAREYRVFCCPGSGRITAMSQYQWHKPWNMEQIDLTQQELYEKLDSLMKMIEVIHKAILDEAKTLTQDGEGSLDVLLLKQGFTFDVLFNDRCTTKHSAGKVTLVELNIFGARSACGSCLYHWINDFDLLYSRKDNIELRVTF